MHKPHVSARVRKGAALSEHMMPARADATIITRVLNCQAVRACGHVDARSRRRAQANVVCSSYHGRGGSAPLTRLAASGLPHNVRSSSNDAGPLTSRRELAGLCVFWAIGSHDRIDRA